MAFEYQESRGSDQERQPVVNDAFLERPLEAKVSQEVVPEPTFALGEVEEKVEHAYRGVGEKKQEQVSSEQMEKAEKRLQSIDKKLAILAEKSQRWQWFFGERDAVTKEMNELIQEKKALVEAHFSSLVEQFSLNPGAFFKAIERGGPVSKFTERLKENIRVIQELEEKMPGSSQRLSRDYGIQNFSRYPREMLIDQLENEDDTETPYGVALYSQNDWNGAIGKMSQLDLLELDEEAKKAGLRVRIIECSGLVSAAKRFISLDKKYGEDQKIQFALVAAHGAPKSIELGDRNLEVESLPEKALQGIASFFAEKPTVILHACSTGEDESGIANALAQVTNAEVIATGYQLTGLEIQSITKTDEGYTFQVVFDSPTLLDMWTRREKPKSFSKSNKI
jgi:Domain of unknown function (DUF4347)